MKKEEIAIDDLLNKIDNKLGELGVDVNLSNKVDEYAISNGYKGAVYLQKWEDYTIFKPYISKEEAFTIDSPIYILATEDGEIHTSTEEETAQIKKSL